METAGPRQSARAEAWRALALGAIVVGLAVTDALSLVLFSAAVLWLAFGPWDLRAGLAVAGAVALALWATADSPVVWADRGWPLLVGGGFVLAKALRPRWRLVAHGIAAVVLGAGLAGVIFAVWPRGWLELDALVASRFHLAAGVLTSGLESSLRARVEGPLAEVSAWGAALFPAALAIASVAALALAQFLRGRLAGVSNPSLGPLREFRFHDQLVWVLIAGIVLLWFPAGAALQRTGANAALFMGALYWLRGAAVMWSVLAKVSVGLGLLLALLAVVLYPLTLVGLLGVTFVGVGDTWFDLRRRLARRANP